MKQGTKNKLLCGMYAIIFTASASALAWIYDSGYNDWWGAISVFALIFIVPASFFAFFGYLLDGEYDGERNSGGII